MKTVRTSLFGSGEDGDITLRGGCVVVLTRDLYPRTLTFESHLRSPSPRIVANGWKVRVSTRTDYRTLPPKRAETWTFKAFKRWVRR